MNVKGELEIDTRRGVIYFHASEGPRAGTTVMRICGLATLPTTLDQIDITCKEGSVHVTPHQCRVGCEHDPGSGSNPITGHANDD